MPHTDGNQGLLVADRLRAAFHEIEITVGHNVLSLQLSVGVAGSDDQETLFFDTLLARAEAALEYSFRMGGNRASIFRKEQISGVDSMPGDPKV